MKQAIQEFIEKDLLSGQSVSTGEDLLTTELLDSLSVMRLVAFIDKKLGIRVPPKDLTLKNFSTIDSIAEYLSSQATS